MNGAPQLMNPLAIAAMIAITLLAAVWMGRKLRQLLPEHQRNEFHP